jgi:defect-in-organelle-trafficking protein DotC
MDNSVDLRLLLDAGNRPASVQRISKEIQDKERLQAILDSAYNYAARKGMQSEMKVIRAILAKNERNLDAIYFYSPLMIHERVVPPVITEAKNIVENKNGGTLKTTGALYRIEKQAYFSTIPPNWRNYLSFPESNFIVDESERPTRELMPKGSNELKLWKEATEKGFRDGQAEAQSMLNYGLNRLNKEYLGMIRFHEFVLAGKVSMPSISRQELAITNNGSVMSLDQKLLMIRTLPSFDGNMMNWNTWLAPVNYDPSKQASNFE